MKPSVGQKTPPAMPSTASAGLSRGDVVRADLHRLAQPLGVLHPLALAQRRQLALVGAEPEVAGRRVARVDADLRLEAAELLARQQRQAHVDRRGVLRAEAAGGAAGAALARAGAAVEDTTSRQPRAARW